MVSLTRCLVVRAIQTHRLFHNEAKATDLESLSIIGLLAEIVQKAGKLPFGYPNGLLAKIMHSNLTNKIKAQPTDFFSVSCALFLVVYYLFINNFCCSAADIIHLSHPQHWVIRFQFFRNIFFFGNVFYQPRKKILSLFFDVSNI